MYIFLDININLMKTDTTRSSAVDLLAKSQFIFVKG